MSPSTLPKYADECLALIQEAVYEARYGTADDDYIGSRLKTIEYLLTRSHPHNYKSKAGVEQAVDTPDVGSPRGEAHR